MRSTSVPLDAVGNAIRPTRTIAYGGQVVLAPRGTGGIVTGGPLLMWVGQPGMEVVVLRDDGSEEQPVLTLGSALPDGGASVFTGDGFLLATRKGGQQPVGGFTDKLVFQHLGLDGSLSPEQSPFPPFYAFTPRVAWTGSEV